MNETMMPGFSVQKAPRILQQIAQDFARYNWPCTWSTKSATSTLTFVTGMGDETYQIECQWDSQESKIKIVAQVKEDHRLVRSLTNALTVNQHHERHEIAVAISMMLDWCQSERGRVH